MKIVDNRKSMVTTFEEIKPGECFVDEKLLLFLKTENCGIINAVHLGSGDVYSFSMNKLVQPVKAGVTIYE